MSPLFNTLRIIKILFLVITCAFGLVYVAIICFARRLHTSTNILLANVCVACIICACFWIIYYFLEMTNLPLMRYDELCWFYSYIQNVSVCQVVYAFCAVSLNRYIIVIYGNNAYFKRRRWAVICMIIQWLLGSLLPAPLWTSKKCDQFGIPWPYQLYKLIVVIIVPSCFTIALNGSLFIFIRKSTLRVQSTRTRTGLTDRDARLLKHISFVIVVYICTWAPIYIAALADVAHSFSPMVYAVLGVFPNFGLLIGTMNLFLHNNQAKRILGSFTFSAA